MRFSFSVGTNGCRFGVSNGSRRASYTPPAQVHQPAGTPPSNGWSVSLNDLSSLASSNPSLNNAQMASSETQNATAITKALKTAVSGVESATTTPNVQHSSATTVTPTQHNEAAEKAPKESMSTTSNIAPDNNQFNSSDATNSPLTLTENADCNPNKIKNAIQNSFIGATKGAAAGWTGAAAGAASAAIASFIDDSDVTRSCKKQKLHESDNHHPAVNNNVNKTINKAIGAAAVAVVRSGNVISAVNASMNKATTHIVSTATINATESVLSDGSKDNNNCNLNKAVIFSNAIGGAAGNYATTLLVPVPCSTTTAVVLGGIGGAVGGYLDAKKEQDACKNTKSLSPPRP